MSGWSHRGRYYVVYFAKWQHWHSYYSQKPIFDIILALTQNHLICLMTQSQKEKVEEQIAPPTASQSMRLKAVVDSQFQDVRKHFSYLPQFNQACLNMGFQSVFVTIYNSYSLPLVYNSDREWKIHGHSAGSASYCYHRGNLIFLPLKFIPIWVSCQCFPWLKSTLGWCQVPS